MQNVVSALNNGRIRLIELKPVDAIKQTLVKQGFSQPIKEYEEKLLDVGTKVRYLYEPGELEGHQYGDERRNDLLTPHGQWMHIESKICSKASTNIVLFIWWP